MAHEMPNGDALARKQVAGECGLAFEPYIGLMRRAETRFSSRSWKPKHVWRLAQQGVRSINEPAGSETRSPLQVICGLTAMSAVAFSKVGSKSGSATLRSLVASTF
jgi:hypothetical protein